jgi:transcriptional regulator with XRE-family HTH domain
MQRSKPFDPSFWPLGPVDLYVGKRLRSLRHKFGDTAECCATVMGISCEKLYRIETGKRHLQPGELILISTHYHIEPLYFFEGFEPSPTQVLTAPSGTMHPRILH